jgi:spore maturation protein A
MLNYIWLGLILAGIIAALTTDIGDLVSDRYRNGQPLDGTLRLDVAQSPEEGTTAAGFLDVHADELAAHYGMETAAEGTFSFAVHLAFPTSQKAHVRIAQHEAFPDIWNDIAAAQTGEEGVLTGTIHLYDEIEAGVYAARFIPDAVRFVGLQRVTNDGIVAYASVAVTIAIGLIGIMALWLGVMKVAEEAGLVRMIASGLKPVMTRLFPDVPPDHPAMGAMILNIAANMLGLANAATPLGLKAMEELNKLNRKIGTATDAMCTFLVINTSSVQLIPATVIAVRASAGSANPAEIIAPMILATAAATIAGIAAVKLLQRLPVYRRQLD